MRIRQRGRPDQLDGTLLALVPVRPSLVVTAFVAPPREALRYHSAEALACLARLRPLSVDGDCAREVRGWGPAVPSKIWACVPGKDRHDLGRAAAQGL